MTARIVHGHLQQGSDHSLLDVPLTLAILAWRVLNRSRIFFERGKGKGKGKGQNRSRGRGRGISGNIGIGGSSNVSEFVDQDVDYDDGRSEGRGRGRSENIGGRGSSNVSRFGNQEDANYDNCSRSGGRGRGISGNIGIGGGSSNVSGFGNQEDANYDNGSRSGGRGRGISRNIGISGGSNVSGFRNQDADYDNGSRSGRRGRGISGNIGGRGSSSTSGLGNPDADFDTNDDETETETSQRVRGSNLVQSIPNHPSQRPMITLYYGGFVEPHVTRDIISIFKVMFYGPWATWREVDQESRDYMFEEFQTLAMATRSEFPFRIFNSLTKQKETFEPLVAGKVSIYVCGVTAYALSHIGHARAYVAFDILVRFLQYLGYEVKYVRNFTDVDDKIVSAGRAYVADEDVYFSVQDLPNYGQRLAGRNLEDNKPGHEDNLSKKQNYNDFALWKTAKPEENISWDSPWGKGRPGWHNECSEM
ncbi:transposase, Ptta/En/Spm, partial [Tanacetum coccineum]